MDEQAITDTPPDLTQLPPPITALQHTIWFEDKLNVIADCTGFPTNSHVLVRVTASNPSQSRLRRTCELHNMLQSGLGSIALVWINELSHAFTVDTVTITPGEYIGISLTAMSPQYLARPPWFIPVQLITTL